MKEWQRRDTLKLLLAGSGLVLNACSGLSRVTKQRLRVVVIGAGFGGATAAKYIALNNPQIEVLLIERKKAFISGPFSNTVIAGMNGIDKITHPLQQLQANHQINLLRAAVTAVDPEQRKVWLASGERIPYDRLVVSPGIDIRWNALEGYDQAASTLMPHAWQAGPQTLLLRQQLQAMPDGGVVVISSPAGPFRCPPGPYERASLIAYYLKRHKPRSKILILDSKNSFAKQPLFEQGWQRLYPGMIEWVSLGGGGRVVAVEAAQGRVHTEIDEFKPDVANIIPPQQAGQIAQQAGLVDSTGWCPVNQQTFESHNIPGIYVIGDSSLAGYMPKSAYAANCQAKVCAQAVVADLVGKAPLEPTFINTCYSLLAPDYAISIAAVYRLRSGEIMPVNGAGGSTPIQATLDDLALEASYARGWYRNIVADSFG